MFPVFFDEAIDDVSRSLIELLDQIDVLDLIRDEEDEFDKISDAGKRVNNGDRC